MYEVELEAERERPLPSYVAIIRDAQYWGVTPMEYLEFPLEWAEAGRIVRSAENEARRVMNAKGSG